MTKNENGKGDKQRDRQISYEEYERRWMKAMGKLIEIKNQRWEKEFNDGKFPVFHNDAENIVDK